MDEQHKGDNAISAYQATKKANAAAARALQNQLDENIIWKNLQNDGHGDDDSFFIIEVIEGIVKFLKDEGVQFEKPQISKEQIDRWNIKINRDAKLKVMSEGETLKETIYAECWLRDQLALINRPPPEIELVVTCIQKKWHNDLALYINEKIRFWEDVAGIVEQYQSGNNPSEAFFIQMQQEAVETAIKEAFRRQSQINPDIFGLFFGGGDPE